MTWQIVEKTLFKTQTNLYEFMPISDHTCDLGQILCFYLIEWSSYD